MQKITILTGNKNNAGDFLIVEKTKQLFEHFLPNTELAFIKRNKPYTEEEISTMNTSQVVIIAGGPAVFDYSAKALNLATCLESITSPIVMFGVGLHNKDTSFKNFELKFDKETQLLMERIQKSPYYSSVRDYKTLKYLKDCGFNNFSYTGCPVLYDLQSRNQEFLPFDINKVNNIVFSVGSPMHNKEWLYKAQIDMIKSLKKTYPKKNLTIAFHHTIDLDLYRNLYKKIQPGYANLIEYCLTNNIATIDISNCANKMIDLYSNCDLHIGYRVHAHVFMTSIRKPSILIKEDGRGESMSEVIKGKTFNCSFVQNPLLRKLSGGGCKYICKYLNQATKKQLCLNYIGPENFDEMKKFFEQFK